MLIDLAVKNFRSIKDKQVFSMLSRSKVKEIESNICNNNKDYKLLKTSIIYGRNGSGKSNLLNALRALKYLTSASADYKVDDEIEPYEPYKLDVDWQDSPIELEINFFAKNGIKYNYYITYNKTEIIKESLFYYPSKKPTKIFVRESGKKFDNGAALGNKYKEIEKTLYPNQSFLSKVGSDKIDSLIFPYLYITRELFVSAIHDTDYDQMLIGVFTKMMIESKNNNFNNNINKLLGASDVGIKGVIVKENKETDFKFPDSIDSDTRKKILDDLRYRVKTIHDLYKDGKIVSQIEFDLDSESTGTKKLMALGGLIVDALNDGGTLVVDELDKSLHPLLTKALIKAFNNKKTNPKNAQLIFASHDSSLLDNDLFRRDQIWFAEKNEEGCSEYYSVADIQNVRSNIPYEKWYLSGRFSAIPIINEYELDFSIND